MTGPGEDATAELAEFAIRLVDAWGDTVAAYLERMSPFIQSLAEIAKDPQVQAAIAALQFSEAMREYRPCHCLCGHAHPADKGICDMSVVTTRRYRSTSVGTVDVPLCAPCAVAQGIALPA